MKRIILIVTLLLFYVNFAFCMKSTSYFLDYSTGEITEEDIHSPDFVHISPIITTWPNMDGIGVRIEIPGAYLKTYGTDPPYLWCGYSEFSFEHMFGELYLSIGGIPFYYRIYDIPEEYDSAELAEVEATIKEFNIDMRAAGDMQADCAPGNNALLSRGDSDLIIRYEGYLPEELYSLTNYIDPETGKKVCALKVYAGQYSYDENTLRALTRFYACIVFKKGTGVDDIHLLNPDNSYVRGSDRIYDLQGRELREPVAGQPYIKGGKVYVEK